MIYSQTSKLLNDTGWTPIGKCGLSNYIVYDVSNHSITRKHWDPVPTMKRVKDYTIFSSEYLNTIALKENTSTYYPILGCQNVDIGTLKLRDAEIYLLGIILTDAYYSPDGHIEIYQSAKKDKVTTKINETLLALELKNTVNERERGGKHYTWRISRETADYLKVRFNLNDRGNPSLDMLFMNKKQRSMLMDAMMDGDGTWNTWDKKYGVFYKPQIIDFFQLLAFTLGYKSKTNSHRKQIYISNVGLEDDGINMLTVPAEPEKWKIDMVEINDDFLPLVLDNNKIFILG